MKQLPVILLIIVLLWGGFTIWRYVEVMSPVWTATAAQQAAIDLQQRQQDAQVDVQAHQERAQLLTGWLQGVGSGLVLLLFAGGAVMVWKQYDQRKESWARAVDGTFALQHFNQAGQTWAIDPNKSVFGVFGVDKRTGQITTDANMIGPDRQLTYAQDVQRTRTAAAVTGGDGFRYAATGKFLSGGYDRPIRGLDAPHQIEDQALPANWHPLTLVDAFNQSTPDRWLLGQNAHGACEFDIFSTVHTGLLGATKCGKTSSTALLMALNAAKHGMKVIALDGAGGVDWQPYNDKFEVYETDYTLIGDQLDQIVHLHEKRTKALKLAGQPNIDELDYQIPSLFVILEEFGKTMQAFKAANKNQYEATVTALSNLMRVSRKTGIYFLIIDQSMAGWDQLIKPNIKDYISYHLGGNQGAAFNAYKLHELKPKGQFWNNGSVYDAWYTRGEAKALLQRLPARKHAMLTDVQYSVVGSVDDRSIVERAESTAPLPSPLYSRSTIDDSQSSPVSDRPIVDASPATIDEPKPQLAGKPISPKDKALVRNTYALTGQYKKTCELLWGKWNPSRDAWAKEVMAEGEVLQ